MSCSTRVPVTLGAITLAKSASLVFTSSWSLTDPAAWTIPRTGLPPSRMWLLSQALTWSPSATSTLAVVIWTPRRSIARMVVDGREVGVVFGQRRPTVPRWDDASAQQRDVPRAAFGEVGRHNAAERSGSAGDDIGRVGGELGGERSRQAAARAQTRDERRSAADRDLILGSAVEKVLADARGGLGAVGSAVVDVDQAAPVLGEFLVADDSAEPPDGGLVDGSSVGFREPVARWR